MSLERIGGATQRRDAEGERREREKLRGVLRRLDGPKALLAMKLLPPSADHLAEGAPPSGGAPRVHQSSQPGTPPDFLEEKALLLARVAEGGSGELASSSLTLALTILARKVSLGS